MASPIWLSYDTITSTVTSSITIVELPTLTPTPTPTPIPTENPLTNPSTYIDFVRSVKCSLIIPCLVGILCLWVVLSAETVVVLAKGWVENLCKEYTDDHKTRVVGAAARRHILHAFLGFIPYCVLLVVGFTTGFMWAVMQCQ